MATKPDDYIPWPTFAWERKGETAWERRECANEGNIKAWDPDEHARALEGLRKKAYAEHNANMRKNMRKV